MIETDSPSVHHGRAMWIVAFAFFIAMAFSAVPTPLYVLYAQRDRFSAFTVSVVFAAYAVGVAISLFLAGHVSDWLGRRRMLLAALIVEVAAATVFAVCPALPGLLAARLLTGLGIGVITATATAFVSELDLAARPGSGRGRAHLVATAANLGGLAAGPLVAGVLARYFAEPLRTPYLIFLALIVIAAAGFAAVPETVEPNQDHPGYRPQRISVPTAARPRYFAALGAAFTAFAVLGLFSSLAPGFVAETLHYHSTVLAGAVAFVAFGSAAIVQASLVRCTARTQVTAGLLLTATGLIPVSTGLWMPSLALFLTGGAIAGAGAGVLVKATISGVTSLAGPAVRGEALAGLFLAGYMGLAVPVLGLGIATQFLSAKTAMLGFVAAMLSVIAAVSKNLVAGTMRDEPES